MRGQIISEQYNHIVWVKDKDGAQYACYGNGDDKVRRKEDLTYADQQKCLNLNVVLGDTW
ncbi:hypothetical protein [Desulfopila sp. IMCC35008]|uniref:hypothetical protein n=1 Tax=Desulfopila sp. IMCC35008 TaxID=2653858 RepID=UPI0013D299BF|nr:hypothetical protein [Desulfopila sp. IMCC35008]